MRYEIYRKLDPNEYYDMKTGAAVPFISYDEDISEKGKILSTGGEDATLEELVGMCDQDAESCNAHDFCGSHRLLGAVLHKHLGRAKATEIMLDIAKYGGQHGMGGICRDGDAYEDLKVGKNGFDWHGKYPA